MLDIEIMAVSGKVLEVNFNLVKLWMEGSDLKDADGTKRVLFVTVKMVPHLEEMGLVLARLRTLDNI